MAFGNNAILEYFIQALCRCNRGWVVPLIKQRSGRHQRSAAAALDLRSKFANG